MSYEKFNENFIKLMGDDRFQLPLREDDNFKDTLINLFDEYNQEISQFVYKKTAMEIKDICDCIIEIINCDGYKSSRLFMEFMEKETVLNHMHIIKNNLPVDGFGRTNVNLFRVREVNENKNYKRKDIFHEPKNISCDKTRIPYRYNLDSRPSLYLGTTVYGCCAELEKENNTRNLIGSIFRLNKNINNLYIIDLGVRPIDYIKNKNKKAYSFTDYLYIYPLIASCSVIVASKNYRNIPEYKISRMLYQWLIDLHNDKLCGIRYFSCYDAHYKMLDAHDELILENNSEKSFTKFFINYAFPIGDEVDSDGYCYKLKKAFLISLPRFIRDYPNIRHFEMRLKSNLNMINIK